jgi:hypothetical protein
MFLNRFLNYKIIIKETLSMFGHWLCLIKDCVYGKKNYQKHFKLIFLLSPRVTTEIV